MTVDDIFRELSSGPAAEIQETPGGEASLEEPNLAETVYPELEASEADPNVVESKEEQAAWADPAEIAQEEAPATSSRIVTDTEIAEVVRSKPIFVQHLAVDPDEPSPPATSPIATGEGGAASSAPVQTGHSAAAPSQRPCIRTRGAKGGKRGKAKQTSRLIKRWQKDFDFFADWLCRESGEFCTHYRQYEDSNSEFIWALAISRVLLRNCFSDQALVQIANVFPPCATWSYQNGYRKHEGIAAARRIQQNIVLPDRDHLNLQAYTVFQTY